MKNLSLFVSAFALCTSTSSAAINCSTLPSCSSLGYTDTVADCPKSSQGKGMVIRCPFDAGKPDKEAKGKCIYEAAVGQIAYFSKAPNPASGWILCDGTSKSRTQYPDLAAFLDTQFCNNQYHLNTACSASGGTFAVPNYKGYFLRVAGMPNTAHSRVGNGNLTVPQTEGLPDISGYFAGDDSMCGTNGYRLGIGGAFKAGASISLDMKSDSGATGCQMSFLASRSNSIYGNSYSGKTGVVPVNIAVYAYIYAGRVVQVQ